MSSYFLGPHADDHLDEIYEYTATNGGEDQEDRYIDKLFEYFSNVASKNVTWRNIPAEFEIAGYFGKCECHFVYWRMLKSGDVGIVAILHERMHQIEQIREVFAPPV